MLLYTYIHIWLSVRLSVLYMREEVRKTRYVFLCKYKIIDKWLDEI